jgi:hypothetical protein
LNVHEVNSVRQIEIHTGEPLIPEITSFEVEVIIEKVECYKLSGVD